MRPANKAGFVHVGTGRYGSRYIMRGMRAVRLERERRRDALNALGLTTWNSTASRPCACGRAATRVWKEHGWCTRCYTKLGGPKEIA
jgi:hypothetical protein